MKTVAIIQARMGSTRLPGKVLLTLGTKSVLSWVIERVSLARQVQQVVVATTNSPADEPIAELCRAHGIACFRGHEHDVLKRFVDAAQAFRADQVIRVNADNPLIDPAFVDTLCEELSASGAEYISYATAAGRPVMLTALSFFAEALTAPCLLRADREMSSPPAREHVTIGIYQAPEQYRVRFLPVPACCNDSRLRFTLDTQADLDLLREIVTAMGPDARDWPADRVVSMVAWRPDWLARMEALNAQNRK